MDNADRPKPVNTAAQLLYIAWTIYLAVGIIHIISLKQSPPANMPIPHTSTMVITLAISLLFMLFFIRKILKGRRWALITYFTIYLISLACWIASIKYLFINGNLIGVATIANYVILFAAFVLLFQKSSRAWFKRK